MSTKSHIVTDGGEMLTKAPEGAFFGIFVGLVLGICFGLVVISGIFEAPTLGSLTYGEKIFIVFGSMFGGAAIGALAGALVGIGTPKVNLAPQQGRFKRWKAIWTREPKEDGQIWRRRFSKGPLWSVWRSHGGHGWRF